MQWNTAAGFMKSQAYTSYFEVWESESSVTVQWWKRVLFILVEGEKKKMAIEIKSDSVLISGE